MEQRKKAQLAVTVEWLAIFVFAFWVVYANPALFWLYLAGGLLFATWFLSRWMLRCVHCQTPIFLKRFTLGGREFKFLSLSSTIPERCSRCKTEFT